ncbi:MAG TPA: ACT domain-containing protein [Acidimicrobiales bacterium]|nr:ACT domain-containing protein [Acidimicrobiales bacterium]
MPHVAVTAVGSDRPGIVAAVTGVFVEHGCNIEDSSMTILRGQFAMMLVVDAPPDVGAADLEAALAGPAADLDLVVAVRPLPAVDDGGGGGGLGDDRWTVSVYGADRPGIVHGVASLLADQGVNIVDLSTRMIGSPEQPVYAMVLEVELPAGVDPNALGDRLAEVAAGLGVEASLHPSDADIL